MEMKDTMSHLRYIVYEHIDYIRATRKEGKDDRHALRRFKNVYSIYKAYNDSNCYDPRKTLR